MSPLSSLQRTILRVALLSLLMLLTACDSSSQGETADQDEDWPGDLPPLTDVTEDFTGNSCQSDDDCGSLTCVTPEPTCRQCSDHPDPCAGAECPSTCETECEAGCACDLGICRTEDLCETIECTQDADCEGACVDGLCRPEGKTCQNTGTVSDCFSWFVTIEADVDGVVIDGIRVIDPATNVMDGTSESLEEYFGPDEDPTTVVGLPDGASVALDGSWTCDPSRGATLNAGDRLTLTLPRDCLLEPVVLEVAELGACDSTETGRYGVYQHGSRALEAGDPTVEPAEELMPWQELGAGGSRVSRFHMMDMPDE